jgi:hypothetical protein
MEQVLPGQPPILWSDVDRAFTIINQNFSNLEATILGGGGTVVDFSNLSTNVSPSSTELYDLGSSTKKWRDLYLSGSSLYLGDAVITATGTTINLPIGSTIGGLRVDENYFKFIAVTGQTTIEADDGTDTLTVAAGNSGITVTTNAGTDTLTITNSGVINAVASTGISVSSATGSVTFTNTGVTSLNAGQGVSLNTTTGNVTITNSGLVGIDPGIGITVSPRDPVTGLVTVTNSQPNIPQNVFNTISVPTQNDVVADSTTDTLTLQTSGNGLSITTDASTDTITFSNTGVHSLAVGNGLTASAGTGSINLTLDDTLSRNIIGNVVGSIFADDSTLLVDGVDGKIVGPVDTLSLKTSSREIVLGFEAGLNTQLTDGIAIGARAGNSMQGMRAVAIGVEAGESNQDDNAVAVGAGAGQSSQGVSTTAVGNDAGNIGQQRRSTAIGRRAGLEYQGEGAVAVGFDAARSFQGDRAISIGEESGYQSQAWRAVAIGWRAGFTTQGFEAISVGRYAGLSQQKDYAVAIGSQAGQYRQGEGAVSLGVDSGLTDQGDYAISMGLFAGETNQGAYSIAIGAAAGRINQAPQSIVLNASGTVLNADDPGFFVNPIRSTFNDGSSAISARPVVYDASTKELFYTSSLQFINNIISTTDSSAVEFDGPVTFQTTITADQGLQLSGPDAIIRSDNVIRIVPTNSLESVGAELAITGLDVMGETNVIVDVANPQGTIQIGNPGNSASVTVRKSTGEVYVGNFWRFLADGGLYSASLSDPPDSPSTGAFYVADGTSWDPASKSGAVPYPVFYDGASYHALY